MPVEREGFDPTGTFVHLADGGKATTVPVGERFWAEIGDRTELHDGRLLTAHDISADMTHWEMHPAGDELLFLASGAVTVVLDAADGERTIALGAGQACVVPAGVWHRLTVETPGRLLFVTPGKGTEHRPMAS